MTHELYTAGEYWPHRLGDKRRCWMTTASAKQLKRNDARLYTAGHAIVWTSAKAIRRHDDVDHREVARVNDYD